LHQKWDQLNKTAEGNHELAKAKREERAR